MYQSFKASEHLEYGTNNKKERNQTKLQTKSSNETQTPKNIIPTFKGWLIMPQGITKGNRRGRRMCIEVGRGKTGQSHEVETTVDPCKLLVILKTLIRFRCF